MLRYDTQYSGLKENELYLLFGTESWEGMTAQQRLDALQEIENRFAGREGREPYRVLVIPPEQHDPGVQGYMVFEPGSRPMIYLNQYYFGGGADYLDSTYNAVGALETVLHEGRHCYQYEAVLNGNDRVDPDTLQAWAANIMRYIPSDGTNAGFGVYEFQPLERDANGFAATELKDIYRHMVHLSGERDEGFEMALVALFESRAVSVMNVMWNTDAAMVEAYCEEMEDLLRTALEDETDAHHELAVIYGLDPDCAREYIFRDHDRITRGQIDDGDYLDGLGSLFTELNDFSDLADDLARFDRWHDQPFTILDGRHVARERLDQKVDRIDLGARKFM